MGTLPDLDTDKVGWIAYWNARDDGDVDPMNAEDVLEEEDIISYELYDNGVILEYEHPAQGGQEHSDDTITVRVKNDGWIVAYVDSYDPDDDPLLITDRNNFEEDVDIYENELALAIESTASNLDQWDSDNFEFTDVGLFNYDYPDVEEYTLLSEQNGSWDSSTHGFLFTENTDIVQSWLSFGAWNTNTGNSRSASIDFDGDEILTAGAVDTEVREHFDANDDLTEDGYEYITDLNSDTSMEMYVRVLVLWNDES